MPQRKSTGTNALLLGAQITLSRRSYIKHGANVEPKRYAAEKDAQILLRKDECA
jgi:hypothetical protein